jgi:dolichol-phosphate mannosyltransferase
MGFKQEPFYYDRPGRQGGVTKYSFSKLLQLASTGMFYFSKKPLKIALFLGVFGIITGLLLTTMVLVQKAMGILETVPGWASLVLTTIFFGGVQLVTIGVLGEYIGNIFDEVRSRPEFIIHKRVNFDKE